MTDYLLAGPILRRVTTEVVCVWLATDREVPLTLSILNAGATIGKSESKETEIAHCQLGKNLFIYLLKARPIAKDVLFPEDTLLSYQLDVKGSPLNLKALGLTYADATQPSFYIPRQLKSLLHGSCRKPHGSLQDALGMGDTELEQTHNNIDQRPALLLLTGDQIYADDVADSILALVKQQAASLLGYQELLPWESLPESRFAHFMKYLRSRFSKVTPPVVRPDRLFDPAQLTNRKYVAKRQAGFSSTEADNHLFTFGEYTAMYLYVFGNAKQWLPDFELEHDFTRREALKHFHETLPNVRRLLANIPTYMICDDHDVTDDWNITGAWYDKVRDLALGQRVVANALASYWAFQAWGNAPENFDTPFMESLTEYFAASPSPLPTLSERFDLNLWKFRGWGFSIPTNPPIIAIDSRTQRQPDGNNYPPQLLDRYALDWLRVEWAKLRANLEQAVDDDRAENAHPCPIFVATTPVMGFAPIEGLQQFLLWAAGAVEDTLIIRTLERWFGIEGKITGLIIYQFDAEAWISNREGFAKFLNCLLHRMNIEQCVFLSGDVHYSFSTDAIFQSCDKTLHCWQLTSSALCNTPSAKNRFDKVNQLVNKNDGEFSHVNYALRISQRWLSKGNYLVLEGHPQPLRVTPTCNLGLVRFDDKRPIKHTLLIPDAEPEIFTLP